MVCGTLISSFFMLGVSLLTLSPRGWLRAYTELQLGVHGTVNLNVRLGPAVGGKYLTFSVTASDFSLGTDCGRRSRRSRGANSSSRAAHCAVYDEPMFACIGHVPLPVARNVYRDKKNKKEIASTAVSYTHLTLPTICSV